MAILKYNTSKVSPELAPTGKWMGHLNTAGTTAFDKVCERIAEKTSLSKSLVATVLNGLFEAIIMELEKGNRISLPAFRVEPQITGSFASKDSGWNPAKNSVAVSLIPSIAVRDAMKGLVPENEMPQLVVRVLGIQDETTMTQNVVHANDGCLIQGENIKVTLNSASAADGLIFRNKDTLVEYKATATESTEFTIDAVVPEDMPVGRYDVFVRSNNCDPERTLIQAKFAGEVLCIEA